MFRKARIKLTIYYSLVFLLFFVSISIGIYASIANFFQERYEREIRERYLIVNQGLVMPVYGRQWSTIAQNIALERLRLALILFNGGLFVLVPTFAWILTGSGLKPVEEAHQREKHFTANVAHDLRTPLTILSSDIEVSLKKTRTPLEYKKLLLSNKEEVDRLQTLTENLLFLARQDTKTNHIQFISVDMVDLVTHTVAHFMKLIQQKKLTVAFTPPEKEISVKGNKTMLEQLLHNLIDNAVKYTEKGKLTITIGHQEKYAVVHIKDTGIGISKEDMEKIFDRFYRVDVSRSQTKGYGLGLAICKTIVDIHKGKITVESEKGKGTTFSVYLPLTG